MKKFKLAKGVPAVLITLLVVASLLVLSIFAGNAFIGFRSNTGAATGDDTDAVTPYIPEKRTYERPEETYEGVQGIVLRSAASAVDTSILAGTQVTDYMIIADSTDPSSAISALTNVGISAWMSVGLTDINDEMLVTIEDVISANDIYGIEIDFCGMPCIPGEPNSDLDDINAFVADVSELVEVYEEYHEHDIKLSAKVYSDIDTCYGYGLDVSNWVANKLVDMISPSSGSEYANTDLFLRMWASLVDPNGVVLAPYIGGQIKNYESSTAVTAQTAATLAGEAAVAITHGADKVCLVDYINKDLLNVLGSYDTVMAADRIHRLTYNSARQPWTPAYNHLPKSFKSGSSMAIRIPIGNILDGATVKVRIVYDQKYNFLALPSANVYLNSNACANAKTVGGSWTSDYDTFEYDAPAAVYDDGYIVFELFPMSSSATYTLKDIQVIVTP